MPLPASYFERSKAAFAAYSRVLFEPDNGTSITGATAAGSSATISKTAHGFTNGQRVLFVSGTGFTGIVAETVYYAVNVAADTFELAATPTATAGIPISVAGSAGVFRLAHVFNAEPLTDSSETPQVEQLKRRGDDGIPGIVDEEIKEFGAAWTFEVDEMLRVLDLFGGKMNGNVSGYATIFVRDTKDQASKVRLKSERFYSSIIRDGSASLGGGAYAKPTLKLTAKKADGSQVLWTANATA